MIKKILIAFSIAALAACTPHAKEDTDYSVMPKGLEDCKVYRVSDGYAPITVVRCPNSETSSTYQSGKTKRTAVVID